MADLKVFSHLFLRTPACSFANDADGPGEQAPEDVLADPVFRLALYLASPAFYGVLEAKDFKGLNGKELLTIRKYLNRMSFRPTPFGLFSAFTVTGWTEEESLTVVGTEEIVLHLLADQQMAWRAAAVPAAPLEGEYGLNATLYRVSAEYRFIKSTCEGDSDKLIFTLESLDVNPLTNALFRYLAKGPQSAEEVVGFITSKTGCSRADAAEYTSFLVEAQLLVPVAGINITGPDYLENRTAPALKEAFVRLRKVSAQTPVNVLKEVAAHVSLLQGDAAGGILTRCFYANAERGALSGGLAAKYRDELAGVVPALVKMSADGERPMLEQFARAFTARFDAQKIPLLQAMDPDAGIGYGNLAAQAGDSALLKGLNMPAEAAGLPQVVWTALHRLLMQKWNGLQLGQPIRIDEKDIHDLSPEREYTLPPSIAVMFRVTEEGLLIESAGGVTGAALIGRFTVLSEEVAAMARDIAAFEVSTNPGVVFAEIAQLSDRHTDNINRRLAVYDYEIPVNSISMLPEDRQIGLADLVVFVRNGEVMLESRRLKKRVVPRLTSAYNYQHNNLAVFRFLCDLQYQGLASALSFDLENFFPGMPFYPRVVLKGAILSPARWKVSGYRGEGAPALRSRLGLPARIALTRFDQQLFFDLDRDEDLHFFEEAVQGMADFTVNEFYRPAAVVSDRSGLPLVNQFIAFLGNGMPSYPPYAFEPPATKKVERDFILGSSWLYLKIYCTQASANQLLVGKILPVVRDLLKTEASGWFFIRYTDPSHHIRLRIRVNAGSMAAVIKKLKARFSGAVRNQVVRSYQADTYTREIERYGACHIEAAEVLFRYSSELVVYYLRNNTDGRFGAEELAIPGFLSLLEQFFPEAGAQLVYLEQMNASFQAEFRADKGLRLGLDKLYRDIRANLEAEGYATTMIRQLKLETYWANFRAQGAALALQSVDEPRAKRTTLLAALIHMHLNRVFPDRQREQEMVLYYCILKHKVSLLARAEKSKASLSRALEETQLH